MTPERLAEIAARVNKATAGVRRIAEFVEHTRQDIPDLLAYIGELKQENARLNVVEPKEVDKTGSSAPEPDHQAITRRLFGRIRTLHYGALDVKYGGSYGVIDGDDGRAYVWTSQHVYRCGPQLAVGGMVSFTPVGHDYATDINTFEVPTP